MATTDHLGMTIPPAPGSRNWNGDRGQSIANNFQLIDDNWDKHDHLVEHTDGHGIEVDDPMTLNAQLGTSITTLGAVNDDLARLIMVLGG